MKHIDDWLDEPAADETQKLVKEWLEHWRRPAVDRDHAWLNARVLRCVYEGQPMRCIGCSRLGDVWLTFDFNRQDGYDKRVDIEDCSAWTVTPVSPQHTAARGGK